MTGITGILLKPSAANRGRLESNVGAMIATLSHRGPDDSDTWIDQNAGIALGCRRLAILDTSYEGNQPMISTNGRYVLVFNGEIYNHQELRQELEYTGYHGGWSGESDTETLLAMIATRGVSATLRKLVGMFAFALWDKHEKTLVLARDRIGEKPLYYGWLDNVFLFGSELKALKAYPGFKPEVDRRVLALYLRLGYIPSPLCIYQGISRLMPGSCITLACDKEDIATENYWSAIIATRKGVREPFTGTEQDAIVELDAMLQRAVAEQMVADVPVGAFLSGGIDSSLIVALMQAQEGESIRTFSIGFQEQGHDEARYARAIADYLGTQHTELYVSPQQARDVIPLLPDIYDEPFADPAAIPMFLASRLAREQVSVCLSGDGGDELFGGNNRYIWTANVWQRFGTWPSALRIMLATSIMLFSPAFWDKTLIWLPPNMRQPQAGEKMHKTAQMLRCRSPIAMYRSLVSHWKQSGAGTLNLVKNGKEPLTLLDGSSLPREISTVEIYLMYLDSMMCLPDDILVKLDRAAMANSLETRTPFLDYRVFEFAQTLPLSFKIRQKQGKWILRELLNRYVPGTLVNRPKPEMVVPLDVWLRGPLKNWANDLLANKRLMQEGYLNPGPVRTAWKEHISGRRNNAQALWGVLMFQSWLEKN